MKKIIFSLSALAALLLAGSCQRENLEPVEQGGTVTYTVQVPGALATKANGDGFVAYYEVYRQGDVETPDALPVYEGSQPFENGSANIELEFVKDQNFVVLFWAQKEGLTAYNTGNLRNVTLNSGLTANQENYEVFAGKDDVTSCVSSNNGNVVLVRPIAQLNIATLTSGLTLGNTVSSSTVEPEFSDLKVTGLYSAYNVATGDVIGNAGEVSYAKAEIKAGDTFNTDYTRVGMNYVGFMPEEGANVEVDFNIYTKKDGNISHKVSNVPVKANYKTNIIGNLISATADYQVTLEDWADAGKDMEVLADGIVKNINGDYEISTAKGLAYAICNVFANGGTFYVLNNIDMTGVSYDPADVPAGTTVHIVGEAPVVTRSSSSVVITGLTKPLLKTVQEGAAASFANIYIEAPIDFVQTNNGVVAFNNCDNTATDSADDLVGDNTGTIAEEGTDINNLALENALKAKASSIKLAGDITASEIIVVDYPVTIDGCGHKLTSTAGRAINVSGADGVTIKNLVIECSGERAINIIQNATNVTIDNVTATAANYTVNVAGSAPDAVVKIENCTLNGLCTVNVASPGAKVSVDNSTINCNDNNTTDGESYAALCLNKAAVGAEIIATNTVVNVTDGSDSSKGRNGAEDGTVTINGSTEDVTVTIAVITYPESDYYYGFETVASAIEFAKETDVISLIRNISIEETIVVEEGKTVVLDLNGKTITGTMHKSVGAVVENNGTLTIQNGTISSTANNGGSAIMNKGTLTVEDATLNGAPNADGSWPSYTVNNTAVMTANNTKFTSYHGSVSSYGEGAVVTLNESEIDMAGIPGFKSHGIYTYNGGKVVVNGGTYANKATDQASSGASVINGAVEVNAGTFSGRIENYYGTPVLKGGTYSVKPAASFVAAGYKAVEISKGVYKVLSDDANYCGSVITNQDGVRYEGEVFETGYMENALWFNNYVFGGEAAIKVTDKTYGAIIIENCSGNFQNDVITIDNTNNSVMILQNLDFTLAEGKKLIKSVNKIYQVFMENITINGVKQTQESIAAYLENVEWYQVVENI